MSYVRGGRKYAKILKDLARRIEEETHVRVGFSADATCHDGTPVAQIAAQNEFGGVVHVPEQSQSNSTTTHTIAAHKIAIPARPFMRTAITNNSGQWAKAFRDGMQMNQLNPTKSLDAVGNVMANNIKESINEWFDPPDSPRTNGENGFNKSLTEMAEMRNNVSYEIKKANKTND